MSPDTVPLAAAAHRTRTGDLWLFRGRAAADRVIQTVTNAPVNHVGVAVVLDDMPPLLWHAELGRALPDVWTGSRHRGVQLHDLEQAVLQWTGPYRQRAWFRQLSPQVGEAAEDAILEVIARWDGVSFPSTGRLVTRWARGRWSARGSARDSRSVARATGRVDAAYCAEVVGVALEAMGVLRPAGSAYWYDPGRFWSGDELPLAPGWDYGREIGVIVPERVVRSPGR